MVNKLYDLGHLLFKKKIATVKYNDFMQSSESVSRSVVSNSL